MLKPEVIDALVAAGVTAEQLAAAMKADVMQEEARQTAKRAKDAARKRAQRERDKLSEMSRGHSVTPADTADSDGQKEGSPQTPLKENISSSTLRFDEGAASAPLDARTLLFRDGLRTLSDLSGRPETKVRSLIGKWLKACDDDALRVLNVISKAKQDRPASPVDWIEAHFQPKPQGNGHGRPQSGSQQNIEALDRWAARRAGAVPDDSFAGTTIDTSYSRRS